MLTLIVCTTSVLLLFCGLSIDVGMMEWKKVQMQTAADSAALGAQLAHDREDTDWQSEGQADAAMNGFQNGTNGVTVQVAEQPGSGDYSGRYDAIAVTISQPVKTIFMQLAHINTVTVTAQSAGLMTPCMYLLGVKNTSTAALVLANQSSIGYYGGSSMGCPVYVGNSVVADARSSIWTNAMNVVGSSASSSVASAVYHALQYNTKVATDPLASLTQPASPASSACSGGSISNVTITINPGVYCGGLSVSGSTVTMNPGLYTIAGGAKITNSTLSGSGVTIFLTAVSGTSNYGQFIVQGSQLSISAGTTATNGSIPGVLFFADRNWVQTSTYDLQFLSGSNTGSGIYYLPAAGIEVSVTTFGPSSAYSGVVANDMELVSSSYSPLSDYSSVPTGNPFQKSAGLVQ